MAVSLDGFVASPISARRTRSGIGGMQLHEGVFELEARGKQMDEEGGEVNASTPVVEEAQADVGAVVMGLKYQVVR